MTWDGVCRRDDDRERLTILETHVQYIRAGQDKMAAVLEERLPPKGDFEELQKDVSSLKSWRTWVNGVTATVTALFTIIGLAVKAGFGVHKQ